MKVPDQSLSHRHHYLLRAYISGAMATAYTLAGVWILWGLVAMGKVLLVLAALSWFAHLYLSHRWNKEAGEYV